jgi:hypothetical protein
MPADESEAKIEIDLRPNRCQVAQACLWPSAKFLTPAKKGLVIGVVRTRFDHVEFFEFDPQLPLEASAHFGWSCQEDPTSRLSPGSAFPDEHEWRPEGGMRLVVFSVFD